MAQDLIRYDLLAQDALRGVVRSVLVDVAKNGLPGDHHFFIGFSTTAPGVRISNRLRERYPEEMTVVLQHQFWDLEVTDTTFSVSLSFNGIPERLTVPFASIRGFLDPSVQFGLQFDSGTPVEANDAGPRDDVAAADSSPDPAAGPEAAETPSTVTAKQDPAPVPKSRAARSRGGKTEGKAEKSGPRAAEGTEAEDTPSPSPPAPAPGAEVVSLDKFRKKN